MKVGDPHVLPHWDYFLCLEHDVARLSRWIAFEEANFGCYSIEIVRLLMAVSSEVDVVAKLLCKTIDRASTADSIGRYQAEIMGRFPNIHKGLATIPRYGIELYPWSEWERPNTPPDWWSDNNKVKHHRSENFSKANLANLLDAMAGLMVLLTLYYRDQVNKLYPFSELFIPKSFLLNVGDNRVRFTEQA